MTARLFGIAVARADGRTARRLHVQIAESRIGQVVAHLGVKQIAPHRSAEPRCRPFQAAMIEALVPVFGGEHTVAAHDVKLGMLLLRREGLEWTAKGSSTSRSSAPSPSASTRRSSSGIRRSTVAALSHIGSTASAGCS